MMKILTLVKTKRARLLASPHIRKIVLLEGEGEGEKVDKFVVGGDDGGEGASYSVEISFFVIRK